MFHGIRKSLIISLLWTSFGAIPVLSYENLKAGEESPPYLEHFDPGKGFNPAPTGLADVYLQLAGSLEYFGHPCPYLRHVLAEHERISAEYRRKLSKEMIPYLPAYMTDEYVDEMCRNWDELARNLKLERLAKDSGRLMRLAIDGEDGRGTSLVLLFNRHQDLVYEDMVSGQKRQIGFQQLKDELLEFSLGDESGFLARREKDLSPSEQDVFKSLIQKQRFTKEDFAVLDSFYDGPHDRLSDYGKSLLSQRVFAGQRGESIDQSDAVRYSVELRNELEILFGHLDRGLSEETATSLKEWIQRVVFDLGRAASSEFEMAIQERALEQE